MYCILSEWESVIVYIKSAPGNCFNIALEKLHNPVIVFTVFSICFDFSTTVSYFVVIFYSDLYLYLCFCMCSISVCM